MRQQKIMQSLKILTLFSVALPLASQQIETDSVIGIGRDAIRITYAQDDGIQINSTGEYGVHVQNAGQSGVFVSNAGINGVQIQNASHSGVFVGAAGNGVYLGSISNEGVYVLSAGGDGVVVNQADGDGFRVFSAGGHSMNIQGAKSNSTLEDHIGLVYNRHTSTNADVLALKVATSGNPSAGNNFITFYNGLDVALGAVEGNGSGGISCTSSGSDYAEYLPLLDRAETFSPGDIVGVYGGHISKQTANAQRVMVITDQAAMIGNKPVSAQNDTMIEGYETVSFIGQVRTKVRGKVQEGDWIVGSGYNDGTAVAVALTDIGLKHQIVGRAWESSSDPEIKRINTAVGLDQSAAKDIIIQKLQEELSGFENAIKDLRSDHQTQLDSQQTQIDALAEFVQQM